MVSSKKIGNSVKRVYRFVQTLRLLACLLAGWLRLSVFLLFFPVFFLLRYSSMENLHTQFYVNINFFLFPSYSSSFSYVTEPNQRKNSIRFYQFYYYYYPLLTLISFTTISNDILLFLE